MPDLTVAYDTPVVVSAADTVRFPELIPGRHYVATITMSDVSQYSVAGKVPVVGTPCSILTTAGNSIAATVAGASALAYDFYAPGSGAFNMQVIAGTAVTVTVSMAGVQN